MDLVDEKSTKFVKPTRVEAHEGYQIWVEFEDGVQGTIDLSGFVECGVWNAWEDRSFFEIVRITPYRAIGWGEDDVSDMCADWAYMQVTDMKPCETLSEES